MPAIQFFYEDIAFKLAQPLRVRKWITAEVASHGKSIETLTYVFCSDAFMLNLNREALDHDYYTDILTFPYNEPEDAALLSDLYISIDRVRDNAQTLGVSFGDELHRVMLHGVLHLLGYDDHQEADIARIRAAEEAALGRRGELAAQA